MVRIGKSAFDDYQHERTHVQPKVIEIAKARKLRVIKCEPGDGFPDLLIMGASLAGTTLYVECKRPKGTRKRKQVLWAEWLRGCGYVHWFIDDPDQFRQFLNTLLDQTAKRRGKG